MAFSNNYNPHPLPTRAAKPLISAFTLLCVLVFLSGCSITTLKQREAELAELAAQQQAVAQLEQSLKQKEEQLEAERERLQQRQLELEQEEKRLEVLSKSVAAVTPAIADSGQATSPKRTARVILGANEYVYLSPPDIQLSAKIDTGATTSSLNAQDMVEFERDGNPYVRFNIIHPDTDEKIEVVRKVVDRVRIKEHEGESQSRPVVKMRIRLGNLDQRVEVTLADRSDFNYQVLIGRNFLRDYAIVDVSKKYTTKPVIGND